MRRPRVGWALVLVLACSGGEEAPLVGALPVPEGRVVVQVDAEAITATSLAHVASSQAVGVDAARDKLVHDALFAAAARRELSAEAVHQLSAQVLARAVLRDLWRQASAQPISDADLAEATEQLWLRYDRPEGRRVVHVVVVSKDGDAPERRARARALAEAIRPTLEPSAEKARSVPAPTRTDDEAFNPSAASDDPAWKVFETAAKGVEHDADLEVHVEALGAVAASGRRIVRGAGPDDMLVPSFTRAAFELRARGDLSPVVESEFGYHVILLLEVTPEKRLSKAERLEAMRPEILRVRALRRQRELMASLGKGTPVELATNADALLESVNVSSLQAPP
jgi:hypothetical protein